MSSSPVPPKMSSPRIRPPRRGKGADVVVAAAAGDVVEQVDLAAGEGVEVDDVVATIAVDAAEAPDLAAEAGIQIDLVVARAGDEAIVAIDLADEDVRPGTEGIEHQRIVAGATVHIAEYDDVIAREPADRADHQQVVARAELDVAARRPN